MFSSLKFWKKPSEGGGKRLQLHRKVNVKMADDKKNPGIAGCVEMPNGYIVLCDFSNRKIKLLDDTLEMNDSLELPDSPWDASVFDGNHIVVTFLHKLSQQLQTIQVFPQLKTERVFSDKYYQRGVTVSGDTIYVSCHVGDPFRGQVRGFDKQGKNKLSLGVMKSGTAMFAKKSYMFQVPNYIALNNDRAMMCVSDLGDNSVTCITTDGDVVYKYKAEDMTQPQGVCFDDSHKVLVCESDSNCITKIEHHGITADAILTPKDGLKKPYSILFRKSDNTLVVGCMDHNDLLIYKYN